MAADAVAAVAVAAVTDLPFLGAGLGYRAPLRSGIYQHRHELPVLEIIADDYLNPTGEQRDELDLLAAHFVLLPHALGFLWAALMALTENTSTNLLRSLNACIHHGGANISPSPVLALSTLAT